MSDSQCELCGQKEPCEKCSTPQRVIQQSGSLNHWPSTQLCMECNHGLFIADEDAPASTYVCLIGVDLGPCEGRCALQEPKGARPSPPIGG